MSENARQNGCPKQSDRYENRISRIDQEKGRNRGMFLLNVVSFEIINLSIQPLLILTSPSIYRNEIMYDVSEIFGRQRRVSVNRLWHESTTERISLYFVVDYNLAFAVSGLMIALPFLLS